MTQIIEHLSPSVLPDTDEIIERAYDAAGVPFDADLTSQGVDCADPYDDLSFSGSAEASADWETWAAQMAENEPDPDPQQVISVETHTQQLYLALRALGRVSMLRGTQRAPLGKLGTQLVRNAAAALPYYAAMVRPAFLQASTGRPNLSGLSDPVTAKAWVRFNDKYAGEDGAKDREIYTRKLRRAASVHGFELPELPKSKRKLRK